jgi:DNA-binding transcriptional ArsR family regulator
MTIQQQLLSETYLSTKSLERIAAYFHVLSEPSRLRLLNLLCQDKASVSELALATRLSIANVSRHLNLMARNGLVKKDVRGNSAIYSISDETLHQICKLVCMSIGRQVADEAEEHTAFLQMASTSK